MRIKKCSFENIFGLRKIVMGLLNGSNIGGFVGWNNFQSKSQEKQALISLILIWSFLILDLFLFCLVQQNLYYFILVLYKTIFFPFRVRSVLNTKQSGIVTANCGMVQGVFDLNVNLESCGYICGSSKVPVTILFLAVIGIQITRFRNFLFVDFIPEFHPTPYHDPQCLR